MSKNSFLTKMAFKSNKMGDLDVDDFHSQK